MEYWPDPLVTTERAFSISAGLDASTVTLGMTAPEESLTVPTIEAWAWAVAGMTTRATRTRMAFTNLRTVTSKVLTARRDVQRHRFSSASDEMLYIRQAPFGSQFFIKSPASRSIRRRPAETRTCRTPPAKPISNPQQPAVQARL